MRDFPRQASLASTLVRPVVKALAKSGLTQKELLGGPIEHTELLWETPPLACDVALDGVPLHMLMESRAPYVVPAKLHQFWSEALLMLRLQPSRVIDTNGWRNLSTVMPKASPGVRSLWITLPRGFPHAVDDYAGVTLSIECAHLLRHSVGLNKLVESQNDYYVETEDGLEVGVRDGLPIVYGDQWDTPVTGMVLDLLRLPRGESFVGCDYDLIAKLRSVGHQYKSKLSTEYEGVDWALQMLRVLAGGKHLDEVQKGIKAFRVQEVTNKWRLKVIRDAIELAHAFGISDRSRVLAIRSLLVPELMNTSRFRREVFHSEHIPAAITKSARDRLQQGLQILLEEEQARA